MFFYSTTLFQLFSTRYRLNNCDYVYWRDINVHKRNTFNNAACEWLILTANFSFQYQWGCVMEEGFFWKTKTLIVAILISVALTGGSALAKKVSKLNRQNKAEFWKIFVVALKMQVCLQVPEESWKTETDFSMLNSSKIGYEPIFPLFITEKLIPRHIKTSCTQIYAEIS